MYCVQWEKRNIRLESGCWSALLNQLGVAFCLIFVGMAFAPSEAIAVEGNILSASFTCDPNNNNQTGPPPNFEFNSPQNNAAVLAGIQVKLPAATAITKLTNSEGTDCNENSTAGTWDADGKPICAIAIHNGGGQDTDVYLVDPPATSGDWKTTEKNGLSNLYLIECDGPVEGGTIKIKKELPNGGTVQNSPTFAVKLDGELVKASGDMTPDGLEIDEMTDVLFVKPGSYEVSETNVPDGWTFEGIRCGDQTTETNKLKITIEDKDEVVCVVKNRPEVKKGKVILYKKTLNKTGDEQLTIGKNKFKLMVGGETAYAIANGFGKFLASPSPIKLPGGVSYTVTEDLPPNPQNIPEGTKWVKGPTKCRVVTNEDEYEKTEALADPKEMEMGGDGDFFLPPGKTVECLVINKLVKREIKTGSISVRKITIGGDGTFNFNVTGQGNFNLKNGGVRKFADLTVGQYTIRETNLPQGWSLQNVSCTGGGTRQGNGITVNLSKNQAITCTFTNFKKRDDRMREVTRLFIHRRVDNLLTHGPDRARMLRRLQPADSPACGLKDDCSGSIKDDPPPPLKLGAGSMTLGEASSIHGSPRIGGVGTRELPAFGGTYPNSPEGLFATEQEDEQPWDSRSNTASSPLFSSIMGQLSSAAGGSQSFKFGTSLSELRASAAASQAQDEQKKLEAAGLDYSGQSFYRPKNTLNQRLDVWIEGQYSGYNDSTGGLNRDGNFRVLYVGADYAIAPGILVGALVQVDDTREDIDDPTLLGEVEGTGWMAGPYIGIRLMDTLYFDARVAWGTSDNDIWLQDAAAGRRSGSFETDRWLASATLTGNYNFGNWRLSPQVGLAYGNESYDTYFNSLGQIVDGGEASIGRVTGGAEVGYQFRHQDGSILEPHIGIKGIWNFHTDDLVVGGALVDSDASRAQIEGGLLYRTPAGFAMRGALSYDGIGEDDFESYTGQLWFNIPLN